MRIWIISIAFIISVSTVSSSQAEILCQAKTQGTLSVHPGPNCPAGQQNVNPVALGLQGPPGPSGPAGPQGPVGAVGLQCKVILSPNVWQDSVGQQTATLPDADYKAGFRGTGGGCQQLDDGETLGYLVQAIPPVDTPQTYTCRVNTQHKIQAYLIACKIAQQ
jgi:hypothetical protein